MTTATLPGLERGSAVFSPCGRYRYRLTRREERRGPRLGVCMANPSYASSFINDHTITKVEGFAERWGYGPITICNLFAFMSTDPAGMYAAADPVGPDNDAHLAVTFENCEDIFVGWGDIGLYRDRDRAVMNWIRMGGLSAFCIGTTKAGAPLHPSRPGYASERMPYRGRPA
jgi:hypothetical protein